MFLEKFNNFLKSDNLIYRFEDKGSVKRFAQKIEASDDINVIYLYEVGNVLKRAEISPALIVDKDGNLLKINNIYLCEDFQDAIFDIKDISKAAHEINDSFREFELEIEDKIKEVLKSKEAEFLKEYKFEDFEENAVRNIVNKTTPHFNFYFSFEEKDIFFLENFYFNKTKLFDEAVEKTVEKYTDAYKTYFFEKSAIEEIEKANKEDDNKRFKREIINILDNPKHKTFTIYYTHPNGKHAESVFAKSENDYRLSQIKRDVLAKDTFNNIPVYAIDMVKWGRSTLIKKEDYKLTIDKSEILNKFVENNIVSNFPKEYYKDKGFVRKIADIYERNLEYADKELMSDKDFCLDLYKDGFSLYNLYQYVDKNLLKNEDFINKIYETINERETNVILSYVKKEDLEDYDYIKFLKSKGVNISEIALRISDDFVFSSKFYDILDGEKLNRVNESAFNKYRLSILEKYLSEKCILRNFRLIDISKEMENKITQYIDLGAPIDVFHKNDDGRNLIQKYIDNDFMLYELSKTITNANLADTFLRELSIDRNKDNDSVLPYCSYNTLFLNLLTDENKKIFIENEIANIETFDIEDGEICFKTDFCTITCTRHSWDSSISSISFNSFVDNGFRKYSAYGALKTTAIEEIYKFVNELTGKTVGNFNEMHDTLEEYNKVKEEIDR